MLIELQGVHCRHRAILCLLRTELNSTCYGLRIKHSQNSSKRSAKTAFADGLLPLSHGGSNTLKKVQKGVRRRPLQTGSMPLPQDGSNTLKTDQTLILNHRYWSSGPFLQCPAPRELQNEPHQPYATTNLSATTSCTTSSPLTASHKSAQSQPECIQRWRSLIRVSARIYGYF